MKFEFIARCGEDAMPIEVEIDYKPGNQSQRARRVAVGKLLALIEAVQASVDASDDEKILVDADKGLWVIGEGRAINPGRGAF